MSDEMVKAGKRQQQKRSQMEAVQTVDHARPETHEGDLKRTVLQETVEMQHREKAKESFKRR